jgi:hypothetical protein
MATKTPAPLLQEDQTTGNTAAVGRATAYVAQWTVVARPAVALAAWSGDRVICNCVAVFFDSSTVRGSFDVLIDGVVSGHLHRRPGEISGKPTWRTGDAAGPLAVLAHRRSNDCSADYANGTERWLEGVLAGIRLTLRQRRASTRLDKCPLPTG